MTVPWEKYLANGITKAEGPVPQRKELRELSEIEMYLFLEGLAKFQRERTDFALSYFQIAGIHGRPYETWPNGNAEITARSDLKTGFGGFCTHTSILFLTWHRPYLALFESALCKHVNDIASGVTAVDKKPYLDAAKAFRLPYWDWAKLEADSVFPKQALSTYSVPAPTTSSQSVDYKDTPNPLAKAPFIGDVPENITLTDRDGRKNKTTVRYPNSAASEKELVDTFEKFYHEMISQSSSVTRNLSERVGYILRSYKKYGTMSHNRFDDTGEKTENAAAFGSFEDIHNSVHLFAGGDGGHMESTSYAAFDPIFWLHHCNIDRLFAIWQILHQKNDDVLTWVQEHKVPTDKRTWSFTKKTGAVEDKNSPLYPFRKSVQGTGTQSPWYNSDDTKWTEDFGYNYPETAGLRPEATSPENIRKLETTIKNLYPSSADQMQSSLRKVPTAGQILLTQSAVLETLQAPGKMATVTELEKITAQLPEPAQLLEESNKPEKPLLRQLAPDRTYLEWLVNIKAVKHVLGGKYVVTVFLGDIQEEAVELWPYSPNFVGTFYPFGQEEDTQCGKCQVAQENNIQVTSQMPLTFALMERYLAGIIADLNPPAVTEFLKKALHWRVTLNDQVLADRSQVAGLTVFVVSNKVTIPEDPEQAPIYDPDVTIYPEITTKQDGSGGRGEGTGLAVGE